MVDLSTLEKKKRGRPLLAVYKSLPQNTRIFQGHLADHANSRVSVGLFLQSVRNTMSSTPTSPIIQRLIDQILRLYPVGTCGELCNSTVCRRGSLVFGRLWSHAKLNHATHTHLSNFFGGIHMSSLSHLTLMGSTFSHHSRSSLPEFKDLVDEPGNLNRLKGLNVTVPLALM
jgi:hypothetical protein